MNTITSEAPQAVVLLGDTSEALLDRISRNLGFLYSLNKCAQSFVNLVDLQARESDDELSMSHYRDNMVAGLAGLLQFVAPEIRQLNDNFDLVILQPHACTSTHDVKTTREIKYKPAIIHETKCRIELTSRFSTYQGIPYLRALYLKVSTESRASKSMDVYFEITVGGLAVYLNATGPDGKVVRERLQLTREVLSDDQSFEFPPRLPT